MKKMIFSAISLVLTGIIISCNGQPKKTPDAQTVISSIITHTGARTIPQTVDVIKTGDPSTKVTGIVTCMFAPMEVLKKAVELNCNLIIVHEPVFYNHLDRTEQFAGDPVYTEKRKYIDDHKLVIWRFHDYIHSLKPDGIDFGMARSMGLDKYKVNGEINRFIVPETTLEDFVKKLKDVFPENAFNVVGDMKMKFTRVSFSAGAPGSAIHFSMLKGDTELLIAGEVPQWETYEYVRDAVSQGRKKAVVFLGHIPSEEAGMEYAAEWIRGFIKEVPVHFVKCPPSYNTY